MLTDDRLTPAHEHSSRHREEIENSRRCGCFYCLAVFTRQDIKKWIDGESTALCPVCGIDSVLGDASGYPIDKVFLGAMKAHWFEAEE